MKKPLHSIAVFVLLSIAFAPLALCNTVSVEKAVGESVQAISGDCKTIESADSQLPFCAMSPIINYFFPDKLRNKRRSASKTASVLESVFILCALTAVISIAFYRRFQPPLSANFSEIRKISFECEYCIEHKRTLFALLI